MQIRSQFLKKVAAPCKKTKQQQQKTEVTIILNSDGVDRWIAKEIKDNLDKRRRKISMGEWITRRVAQRGKNWRPVFYLCRGLGESAQQIYRCAGQPLAWKVGKYSQYSVSVVRRQTYVVPGLPDLRCGSCGSRLESNYYG